jgi:hypothetical protein
MFLYNKMIPSLYSGLQGNAEVPTLALIPSASFMRHNLLTKQPSLGFVDPKNMHQQPMMNDTTSISTARRVLHCRNDLRILIGRPPKDRFNVGQVTGIGRNTNSIFPREKANNGKIMIPSDSHVAYKRNNLGIPK